MSIQNSAELSPREYQEFLHRKEEFELQSAHTERLKDKEIELAKLEAKWNSWLRIPITIVKLPIMLIMAVAYIVAISRKFELGEHFWQFMR